MSDGDDSSAPQKQLNSDSRGNDSLVLPKTWTQLNASSAKTSPCDLRSGGEQLPRLLNKEA